jgi:hypothetical protein
VYYDAVSSTEGIWLRVMHRMIVTDEPGIKFSCPVSRYSTACPRPGFELGRPRMQNICEAAQLIYARLSVYGNRT